VPEICDLLIIIGWGESGRAILPVIIAVFQVLSGKDGSAPSQKKISLYPHE